MIVVAACAVGARPAEGQWRLDAQAGRLQYEAAPDAITTTVALGLSRSALSSTYGVAVGVPFSNDEPVWGALHGYRRLARTTGEFGFGVDLSANGFGYRIAARDSAGLFGIIDDGEPETGWGVDGEVMPLAFWRSGLLAVETRAGVVGFMSASSNTDAFDRTALVADASLAATPTLGLTARLEGRFVSVTEDAFPYAGVGITWTRGLTLWGSVGQWLNDTVESPSWDAGLAVPVGERVSLSLNGRHDPIDPVYGTPSRTTWGAGVSVSLGPVAAAIPEPVPAAYENGVATIALDDDDIEGTPSIAGDFNQWTPTPMERADDGWLHRVSLEPGVYNYAFVDAAGNWFVPEDTPGRRSDGMGGWVAVLVVEGD